MRNMLNRLIRIFEGLLSETVIKPYRYGVKVGKRARKTQIPPPRMVVYGILAAITFFVGLTAIELAHIIVLRSVEPTALNLMGYIVTFLLGTLFGVKSRSR
ncbi:MAG: hypothetical protein QXV46_07320 [Candidatus Bathyarchaeia archaeon]